LETVSPELNAANLAAFRKGLSEFGFMDGQNLRIEYRSKDATRIKQLGHVLKASWKREQINGLRKRSEKSSGVATPSARNARARTRKIGILMGRHDRARLADGVERGAAHAGDEGRTGVAHAINRFLESKQASA
jgi:hypothetical protein